MSRPNFNEQNIKGKKRRLVDSTEKQAGVSLFDLRLNELNKKSSFINSSSSSDEPKKRIYIAIYAEKGGVGKTTITSTLGFMMARAGKRVLMYDCDPQRNLTTWCFGKELEVIFQNDLEEFINSYKRKPDEHVTFFDQVFIDSGSDKPDYSIRPAYPIPIEDNLFLVPGHRDISRLDSHIGIVEELSYRRLTGVINYYTARPFLAIEATAKRCNAEYILLDLNPSRSVLNQRLISMCDYLIVPCLADFFGYQSVSNIYDDIADWKKSLRMYSETARRNPFYGFPQDRKGDVKFLGAVINNYHPADGHYAEVKDGLVDDTMNRTQRIWFEKINNCLKDFPILHGKLPRSSNILAKVRHFWKLSFISNIFFLPVPLLTREHAWKSMKQCDEETTENSLLIKMSPQEIEHSPINNQRKTFLDQVAYFDKIFSTLINYIFDIVENDVENDVENV